MSINAAPSWPSVNAVVTADGPAKSTSSDERAAGGVTPITGVANERHRTARHLRLHQKRTAGHIVVDRIGETLVEANRLGDVSRQDPANRLCQSAKGAAKVTVTVSGSPGLAPTEPIVGNPVSKLAKRAGRPYP